jgi:DNA-binding NarL/FixJ family response regulator
VGSDRERVPEGADVAGGVRLSSRQRHIIDLMSRDLSDERIAEKLGISVRTVRYDICAIMSALGVRSRFAAGLRCAGLPREER